MLPETATIIGTGTMGPGIAAMFALAGIQTTLCGRSDGSVERGLARARLAVENLDRFGLLDVGPERRGGAAGLLVGSTDLSRAVADAGIVVESIAEDLAAKQALFARLGELARPDATLATNTSGLRISEIAATAARPQRIVGMHWWNPPHLVPLVEVVRGERTGDATVEQTVALSRRLGKTPVVVNRDVPGFLANRLQYALLREAARILDQGLATVEDVDAAMRAGPGLRWAALGPFEVADFIGHDVIRDILAYLLPAMAEVEAEGGCHVGKGGKGETEKEETGASLFERLAEAGTLGVKSGHGVYDYAGRSVEELLTERDAKLAALLKAGFGR
jgi:3-hydroxybutyryl-CoA dehydrogenase